jgi:hypothetical protein
MRVRLIAAAVAGAVAALVIAPLVSGQGAARSKVLFSVMTGAKEVSPQGEKGAGDRNGKGSFTALIDGGELCFGMAVRNIEDPIAAHVHAGGPNVAGDIVVPLEPHPSSGDPGASSGCTEVSGAQARALLRRPGRFYVNVHTDSFPGGAVRGQLFARR